MPQNVATLYPKMAPIGQYLMDRTTEIALARSPAPESISRNAEADLNEALEWGRKAVVACRAPVEVRPFGSQAQARLKRLKEKQ
jgi:hypothetical protein